MRGDSAAYNMSNQPTPALLNATGHALLRSIANGQSAHLLAAAAAIERLGALLPTASAEARLTAALLAVSDGDPATPAAGADAATPASSPTRARQAKDKPVKQTRKSKAATPRMDASGRLQPSKEVGGVAVISQAQARKVLGMNCPQMIKLENQKLLSRIQESGSRLVFYRISEVQHLLDMIDATPPPPL